MEVKKKIRMKSSNLANHIDIKINPNYNVYRISILKNLKKIYFIGKIKKLKKTYMSMYVYLQADLNKKNNKNYFKRIVN